jgi:MFS family permease
MTDLRNDRPAVPPQGVGPAGAPMADPAIEPDAAPTLGALVHDLSTQVPELIRSELKLAQAELTAKGKRAGMGIGAFGAAGLLVFYGVATLIATAVLALALALPAWLAALIVGVALLIVAGVVALVGRKKVQEASPLKPERAMTGVQEDVATMKGER